MEDSFKLGLTDEEEQAMIETEIQRMLAGMRQMNEEMISPQQEIDRQRAKTREIIGRIKEHRCVETSV